MSNYIKSEVNKIKDYIISKRRDFHEYPELGFNEIRSGSIISKELRSLGFSVIEGVGKTGVVGILSGDFDGPTIALRADMDALPIQETSDISYKSKNEGIMHACGHDGHMAMLLGAAKIIAKSKSNLKGCVKFIFQPAEEGFGGARYMIKDNVLDGVDEIYGAHLWNYQPTGTIGIKSGPVMAAADLFEINIIGTGGHGATPHGTVDAILVASHVIQSLQSIVSRNTNPLESSVVSIGKINGGYNFNIISDHVTLKGTTRSYSEDNRSLIKNRMKEILDGISKSFNAEINLDYKDGYPPVINETNCTRKVLNAAKKIVEDNAIDPYLTMGGEDFSYFLQKIPGCFFFIGSAPDGYKPQQVPHHCSHFDINEESLLLGTSTFVQLIEDLLINI